MAEIACESLTRLTQTVLAAGGSIVYPSNSGVLSRPAFRACLAGPGFAGPTLAYGQRLESNGLHVMDTPTDHSSETLAGLGATGVEIVLACVGEHPVPGHPMLPVLQTSCESDVVARYGPDLDHHLGDDVDINARALLDLILQVASRQYTPAATRCGNLYFQLTRGHLGLSM